VRIRFYGDYEEALTVAGFLSALEACAILTDATASGEGPLLLIELFADDPYLTIARLSVEFAGGEGRPPGQAELLEAYYGLPVPHLILYVGFAQPRCLTYRCSPPVWRPVRNAQPLPGSHRTATPRDPIRSSRNAASSSGGLRCPLSRSTAGTYRVRRALQWQHPGYRSHRLAYRPMTTAAPHARPLRVKPAASAPHLRYRQGPHRDRCTSPR
jgi:hypothetical protein